MEKTTKYRSIVKRGLTEFAQWVNGGQLLSADGKTDAEETICVFDDERDQYMVVSVTWGQFKCVRSTPLFVRIRNGKIWIEEDWTNDGFATDLLEAGVPNEDIVLGFQPPEMRIYTEFAVA